LLRLTAVVVSTASQAGAKRDATKAPVNVITGRVMYYLAWLEISFRRPMM
jgi:hypothetical protein